MLFGLLTKIKQPRQVSSCDLLGGKGHAEWAGNERAMCTRDKRARQTAKVTNPKKANRGKEKKNGKEKQGQSCLSLFAHLHPPATFPARR